MNGETGSPTRILFVDDSKVMLKTASKILGAEFHVTTAVDGDDAWSKLDHDHDIQVLFTDINMPGTDGYGLLKKVRTSDDPGLRGIPVIMVTGADDDEAARAKAMELGATDFINKKAATSELLPRARAHAKYQRMTRQLQAQSTLDALTGLANEHGFLGRLEQDIFYARRHRQPLALMRVEIDGLATTFQQLGEDVVEHVIVHVADLLRVRMRHEDTAGRIGLGGFAVSTPGGTQEGIEAWATSLERHAAMDALEIDGQLFPILLYTAVVGAEQEAWASPHDALAHCQALLDRKRRQATPKAPVPESHREHAFVRAREKARTQLNALQRSLAHLRSIGVTLWAGVVRFYKKLVGR